MLRGSMQYSLPDKIIVTQSEAIDWYDGIITGLIKIADFNKWLFLSLIAFDFSTRKKVYALFVLDDDLSKRYLETIRDDSSKDDKWTTLDELNRKVVNNYQGEFFLASCIRHIDDDNILVSGPIENVSKLKKYLCNGVEDIADVDIALFNNYFE